MMTRPASKSRNGRSSNRWPSGTGSSSVLCTCAMTSPPFVNVSRLTASIRSESSAIAYDPGHRGGTAGDRSCSRAVVRVTRRRVGRSPASCTSGGTAFPGRNGPARAGGGGEVSVVVHVVLAVVLTLVLACQAGAFAAVLRSRRVLAAQRPPRIRDLVWVAIPVAVVLFLAARSWIVALDLGPPAMANVRPVDVSARPPSPPIFHR